VVHAFCPIEADQNSGQVYDCDDAADVAYEHLQDDAQKQIAIDFIFLITISAIIETLAILNVIYSDYKYPALAAMNSLASHAPRIAVCPLS